LTVAKIYLAASKGLPAEVLVDRLRHISPPFYAQGLAMPPSFANRHLSTYRSLATWASGLPWIPAIRPA
jgi:hypothetical protein